MDTAESDRRLIEKILVEYAKIPYSYGDVRLQTVFDRDQDHYLLVMIGWERVRRVHGCLVHVDIIDGKLWIQCDGTEYGIAQDLLDAGVIFGTGFAPFRGGPLAYARARGVSAVIARLQELAARHGARFRPDEGWVSLAAGQKRDGA